MRAYLWQGVSGGRCAGGKDCREGGKKGKTLHSQAVGIVCVCLT
jgi:hypothetical protein